jgi:hypothetical protein
MQTQLEDQEEQMTEALHKDPLAGRHDMIKQKQIKVGEEGGWRAICDKGLKQGGRPSREGSPSGVSVGWLWENNCHWQGSHRALVSRLARNACQHMLIACLGIWWERITGSCTN